MDQLHFQNVAAPLCNLIIQKDPVHYIRSQNSKSQTTHIGHKYSITQVYLHRPEELTQARGTHTGWTYSHGLDVLTRAGRTHTGWRYSHEMEVLTRARGTHTTKGTHTGRRNSQAGGIHTHTHESEVLTPAGGIHTA